MVFAALGVAAVVLYFWERERRMKELVRAQIGLLRGGIEVAQESMRTAAMLGQQSVEFAEDLALSVGTGLSDTSRLIDSSFRQVGESIGGMGQDIASHF